MDTPGGRGGGWTQGPRPPVWWELPMVLIAVVVCTALSRASFGGDKVAAAQANAQAVLGLERRLGLDIEVPANQWHAGHGWLRVVVAYHYATVYILTSVALLVFLYLRRPPLYRWARRSSLVLNVVAAICFALYPVAPPRLNLNLSIVDTVQEEHIWGTWGSPVGDAVNQLAALPSLHLAWVLWVLAFLVVATRSLVLIGLAALDVVITAVTVVATGNHYPLDLVAAALLVAVSIGLTRPWSAQAHDWFAARLGRLGDTLRAKAILVDT